MGGTADGLLARIRFGEAGKISGKMCICKETLYIHPPACEKSNYL